MADLWDVLNTTQPETGAAPAQPQTPQSPQVQPPSSPEEFNARTNGWMGFLSQLRSDPNLSQALMFMGARMLQPNQVGQGAGGALGEALWGGTQLYGQLGEAERQQAQAEEKRQAEIAREQAQTEEFQQRTAESRALTPGRLKLQTSQAELAAAEARVQAAKAAGIEALDPKLMAKYEQDLAMWKVRAEAALVGERGAQASAASALAKQRTEAGTAAGKVGSRAVELRNAIRDSIQKANPTWDVTKVEQELLRREETGRVKALADRIDAATGKYLQLSQTASIMGETLPPLQQWLETNYPDLMANWNSQVNEGATPTPVGTPLINWTRDANGNPVRVK